MLIRDVGPGMAETLEFLHYRFPTFLRIMNFLKK